MGFKGSLYMLGFGSLLLGALIVTGCATNPLQTAPNNDNRLIKAVAAENYYADVLRQIGGPYVSVNAIMSNPNTDPHSYEANTVDAGTVSQAQLVVQNGLGYDGFMDKLEAATPDSQHLVINVGEALGYSSDTPNPHLWYKPSTMPQVASLIEKSLAKIDPAHAGFFKKRLQSFDASLGDWTKLLTQIKTRYPHAPVAVTEPVADYMLDAAGLNIMTPWPFQVAVANGVDPSPQNVQYLGQLLEQHRVKVLVYNLQAVDNVTQMLKQIAANSHVPIVGVYETMPANYHYQEWMTTEARAIMQAIAKGKSTQAF